MSLAPTGAQVQTRWDLPFTVTCGGALTVIPAAALALAVLAVPAFAAPTASAGGPAATTPPAASASAGISTTPSAPATTPTPAQLRLTQQGPVSPGSQVGFAAQEVQANVCTVYLDGSAAPGGVCEVDPGAAITGSLLLSRSTAPGPHQVEVCLDKCPQRLPARGPGVLSAALVVASPTSSAPASATPSSSARSSASGTPATHATSAHPASSSPGTHPPTSASPTPTQLPPPCTGSGCHHHDDWLLVAGIGGGGVGLLAVVTALALAWTAHRAAARLAGAVVTSRLHTTGAAAAQPLGRRRPVRSTGLRLRPGLVIRARPIREGR